MASPDGGAGRWAAIARKEAPLKVDVPLLKSTAGLTTVVVDANALIGGGVKLPGIADQFVTVPEVLAEVRDPASRFHLATLPITIRCLEPSSEALAAVTKFSRATGDLQSLSSVDVKLLALAYTLEAEVHGTANIRTRPPPLLVTHSSTREKDPPGWGVVDDSEEWDGVEQNEPGAAQPKSRILGLKSLTLYPVQSDGAGDSPATAVSIGSKQEMIDGREHDSADNLSEGLSMSERAEASSIPQGGSQPSPTQEGLPLANYNLSPSEHQKARRGKPEVPQKQGLSLEGKLNVASGLDASKGEDDYDGDDWQRASSRSTRRNYLKREGRRAARRLAAENAIDEIPYSVGNEQANSRAVNGCERQTDDLDVNNSRLLADSDEVTKELRSVDVAAGSCSEDEAKTCRDLDEKDAAMVEGCTEGCDNDASTVDDTASNCTEAPSHLSGAVESEESWMMAPLWKSSIACMTADFAMQNVLLQMGLRLLSTNGMHIREVNKWVLKCQACNHVVTDVGRLFCPKCGNGGTLSKVSITVGQNGIVHAGRPRRVNLRGTRYSLPMPKGGREGAAQNPILCEDQLPKVKKTGDIDRSISTDVNFTITRPKKTQNLVSVKTAAAVFSGRRNPNERRGARG